MAGGKGKAKPKKRTRLIERLTDAQRVFVARYTVHRKAKKAYHEAYPDASEATCESEGPRILKLPHVAAAVKREIDEIVRASRHSATRTLDELARIAYGNMQDYYGDGGALISPADLPRELAGVVKKVKRKELIAVDGDGNAKVAGHEVEFELHDKLGALRDLGRHYGLFKEVVEVDLGGDLAEIIRKGRERVIADLNSTAAGG